MQENVYIYQVLDAADENMRQISNSIEISYFTNFLIYETMLNTLHEGNFEPQGRNYKACSERIQDKGRNNYSSFINTHRLLIWYFITLYRKRLFPNQNRNLPKNPLTKRRYTNTNLQQY